MKKFARLAAGLAGVATAAVLLISIPANADRAAPVATEQNRAIVSA